MTEWHMRYGGRGVMIYWHVDENAACIYSQLKRCSSSEVASMIEGVLHHCTEMEVDRQYVDTHGQSVIAFAFCHLLGFSLMPRFKGIDKQKLALPEAGARELYRNLEPIFVAKAINWALIAQQYDELIKFATALRERTAEPKAILRRFTRTNTQHPKQAGGSGDFSVGAAPPANQPRLCQYVDDPAGIERTGLAHSHDRTRHERPLTASSWPHQPLWDFRFEHERAAGVSGAAGGGVIGRGKQGDT